MPIHADFLTCQRKTGFERHPPEPENHRPRQEREAPFPQKTDTSPGDAGLQEQPRQKRLNLITPPADHRFMKGRY